MTPPQHGDLLETVLAGISDTLTVSEHTAGPSPFNELVRHYQYQTERDDRLPKITGASTGRELKDAIGSMEPNLQLIVLSHYNHAVKDLDSPSEYDPSVLNTQTKALRTQVYWIGGTLLFFMLAVLVGATVATAVHMNVISEGEAVKNLLETAKSLVEVFLDLKSE
jgi:hypothetical protein